VKGLDDVRVEVMQRHVPSLLRVLLEEVRREMVRTGLGQFSEVGLAQVVAEDVLVRWRVFAKAGQLDVVTSRIAQHPEGLRDADALHAPAARAFSVVPPPFCRRSCR